MSDKKLEYAVSADPAGFKAGMDAAVNSIRDATSKIEISTKNIERTVNSSFKAIEGQMKGVSDVFKTVTGALAGLTALVAGGGAFKNAIGEAAAWSGEAKKLGTQLGLSTERASVYMVAMRHLGIDSELVSGASAKMSKQIFSNGQAFEKLGVQVKDANGQYRPTVEIMSEVNGKLKAIQNPIEQNIAGMQVYGKGWQEIRGTLKLTTEEIQKAEQQAKDLGLVVGDEGAAQAKKYKESLNDMKLVMTSLEVQLGNAVMPAFVKLGGWMSSVAPTAGKIMGAVMESLCGIMSTVGSVIMQLWSVVSSVFSAIGDVVSQVFGGDAPTAMQVFVNALKVIEIAALGMKYVISQAIEVVTLVIESFVARVMRMAAVGERALKLDFSGAKAAWDAGTAKIEAVQQKHSDRLVAIGRETKDKLDEIAMRGPKAETVIKDKNFAPGPTYSFDKEGKDQKSTSRMSEWEEKLAIDKDGFERQQQLAGTAQEFSKTQERDFWKDILATAGLSAEEKTQVNRRYLAIEHDLRKQAFESEIAGERGKLEEFQHNYNERIVIASRIYADMKARYGVDSKEAKAALGDIAKEQRKLAEQTLAVNKVVTEAKRSAGLAEIDFAQKDAELQLALGQITAAKLLDLDEGFEAKRYQIKAQAILEELALRQGTDKDPVAIAALNAKMEELERQHQIKIKDIKGRAMIEQNRDQAAMFSNIRSGFENSIAGMLQGTMTLKQGLAAVWQSVLQGFAGFIAKKVVAWALGETAQTGATVAGNATRTASDWMAAAGSVAANAWSAVKNIAMKAWEVAASVYSALASIPYIGPFIAPVAAVAATGVVLGFASHIASAEGGYDIPAGLNPMTQLHEKEMVLPAKHADVIRSMANGEGGGMGGSTSITIHAVDAASVKKLFADNGGALVAALKKQHRNFAGGN